MLGRSAARRAFERAVSSVPRPPVRFLPFIGAALDRALPEPTAVRVPFALPPRDAGAQPTFFLATSRQIIDAAAPPLDRLHTRPLAPFQT